MADNKDKKVLNVPHLRFPEFTEEWKRKRFKDVCNITTGNKNTQDKSDDGIYPFYVRSQIVERINSWTFDGEAILTAGDGVGVGKVFHYSTGKIGVHQRVYILSDFKCDGKYLYSYFAGNFYNRVKRMSAKNSVDSVRMEMIADMPISLPSNEEQKKIGHLLALLDERIATQNKVIEKLESLIKGLNNSLYYRYGDGIRTSFAGLGYSYSGLSGKSAMDFGKGKPFITYLNVYSNNVVNDNDYQYVQIDEGEKQNVVQYGDVLFTLSSETPEEVGIGSVYLGQDEVYLNSFCFGIHIVNEELAYSPYISYYVSSTPFRKFIYPFAQGSTRFNLCKADFEKACITLPSLDNQKRIHSVLNSVAMKISTERAMLEQYVTQKQYLLRQMFI
ncbi:restriction endonuclease subunit S [Bacteroides faecis]|uniref:restriction endonuclease subunit S n=1 Tax=Bacteroides faecis TaxID=674529 RepID=UPI0021648290|nr:restriction endonuclease subunit S [Bacteroides faecis]UVS36886.1 restriction endonuclease subunit S [Bacteroides faecis]